MFFDGSLHGEKDFINFGFYKLGACYDMIDEKIVKVQYNDLPITLGEAHINKKYFQVFLALYNV